MTGTQSPFSVLLDDFNVSITNSGTLNLTGTLTVDAGTFTLGGSSGAGTIVGGGVSIANGVVFNAEGTTAADTLNDVSVMNSGTLQVDIGGGTVTLDLSGGTSITGGALKEGASSGALEIKTGGATLDDVTITSAIPITIDSGVTLGVNNGTAFSTGTITDSGGTLDVTSGTIKFAGSSAMTIDLNSTGQMQVAASATVNDAGVGLTITSNSGTAGSITNDGAWEENLAASTDTTTISDTFSSTGTAGNLANVEVNTGTLNLSGGGSDTYTNYSGSGTLEFNGGTRTLDGNSSVTTAKVNVAGGTVTDNGTYNVAGTTTLSSGALNLDGTTNELGALSFTGGTLSATGVVTDSGAASFTGGVDKLTGAGELVLDGASTLSTTVDFDGGFEISNRGTLTWNGGADINLGYNGVSTGSSLGGGTLDNAAGATFQIETDWSITTTKGTTEFSNEGTITQTVTTGAAAIDVNFVNTGTVEVETGTLQIGGNGSSALSGLSVSSGATLDFNGQDTDVFTLTGGGTLSGSGKFEISGSELNIGANDVTVTNFEEDTGILTGGGVFTVSGTATFANGGFENLMTGTGEMVLMGTTTIAESVGMDAGWELQNQGTLTWTGGDIYIGYNEYGGSVGGGTFDNALGATLNIELGSNDLAVYDRGASGIGTFTNEGTIIQSATTGTTQFLDLSTFQNSGTVEVQTGTLDITNAATGAGGYTIGTAAGGTATLEFDSTVASGATVTFEGSAGILYLTDPSGFAAQIAGITGTGDVIDLAGYNTSTVATSGVYNSASNTTPLTITDSGNPTLHYTLVGNLSGDSWTDSTGTYGGVDIADPPALIAAVASSGSSEINGASAETVAFAAATGLLILNDPSGFTGQITGFTGTAPDAAHSDVIDLVGINYNSSSFAETYNSTTGLLTVTDGTHSASITFDNFNATLDFASDGNGGTDIFDPPSTGATHDGAAPAAVDAATTTDTVNGNPSSTDSHAGDIFNDAATPDGSDHHGSLAVDQPDDRNGHASLDHVRAGFDFTTHDNHADLAASGAETQSDNMTGADVHHLEQSDTQSASVSIGGPGNDHFVFAPDLGANNGMSANPQQETVEHENSAQVQTAQELQALISHEAHGDAAINLSHHDAIAFAEITEAHLQHVIQAGHVLLH